MSAYSGRTLLLQLTRTPLDRLKHFAYPDSGSRRMKFIEVQI